LNPERQIFSSYGEPKIRSLTCSADAVVLATPTADIGMTYARAAWELNPMLYLDGQPSYRFHAFAIPTTIR
jgi:hypothetical protein